MARRRWTKEEKMQIVLTGLKDGVSADEIFRRHGISQSLYYQRKREFLSVGALALEGKAFKRENRELKEVIADLSIMSATTRTGLIQLLDTEYPLRPTQTDLVLRD